MPRSPQRRTFDSTAPQSAPLIEAQRYSSSAAVRNGRAWFLALGTIAVRGTTGMPGLAHGRFPGLQRSARLAAAETKARRHEGERRRDEAPKRFEAARQRNAAQPREANSRLRQPKLIAGT